MILWSLAWSFHFYAEDLPWYHIAPLNFTTTLENFFSHTSLFSSISSNCYRISLPTSKNMLTWLLLWPSCMFRDP
jgi:hypothetical protein